MTTKFISNFPHLGLYCVWIKTGNPRRPLACIWIDPETRTSGLQYVRQPSEPRASRLANKTEACRDRKLNVSRRLATSRQRHATPPGVALSFALIAIAVLILLNAAWADIGGRIRGCHRSQWCFRFRRHSHAHEHEQRNQTNRGNERSGTVLVSSSFSRKV